MSTFRRMARGARISVVLAWLLLAGSAGAIAAVEEEGLEIVVTGVTGAMADNVRSHVAGDLTSVTRTTSRRARAQFRARAEDQAVIALRPFGHYRGTARAAFESFQAGWRLTLAVDPGPPVLVESVELLLRGPGAEQREFVAWREAWPLPAGAVLDQRSWEEQKTEVLEIAESRGFLGAALVASHIELDLLRDRAALRLELDTGPRSEMGEVIFEQDFLDERILRPVPRFRTGDGYRAEFIENLRTDLWKLGYFETIDVVERRVADASPPRVDLTVRLTRLHRATHQGTIGYGTDTEFRTQYRFQRHQLSKRGDVLIAGFTWQTRDEEYQLFGEYRLPRHSDKVRYWLLNPIYRERDERLELDVEGREQKLAVADYRVDDFYMRAGHLTFRNPSTGRDRLQETIFVDFLWERNTLKRLFPGIELPEELAFSEVEPVDTDTASVGVEWDWPRFEGSGFELRGHRERAWIFTSNEAWGSDIDFTQVYLSSRWNFRLGGPWRLLLRGEIGYTDAAVRELEITENGETFLASITRLPARYRFRAGGSHSVRGYDFEELSNNGVGSNNIVTASVEVERKLFGAWSAAAFVDTGNAFNDWSETRLATGAGVGVRWYTAGFPLRLDVAQALDLDGNPWRIHFTIGSPLF